MKKVVLVMTAIALIFAGCKKEEVEPAPQPAAVTHKPITKVDLYILKQGFTEEVQVLIKDELSQKNVFDNCNQETANFKFNIDDVYTITFEDDDSTIYNGDIKFVADTLSDFKLEEVGTHLGTAKLEIKNCPILGDQLFVVKN